MTFIASSIVAVGSSGATISAFAQLSVIDFELHDLPPTSIPGNTPQRRFDTVSSTS
jgi:hypothetical protein